MRSRRTRRAGQESDLNRRSLGSRTFSAADWRANVPGGQFPALVQPVHLGPLPRFPVLPPSQCPLHGCCLPLGTFWALRRRRLPLRLNGFYQFPPQFSAGDERGFQCVTHQHLPRADFRNHLGNWIDRLSEKSWKVAEDAADYGIFRLFDFWCDWANTDEFGHCHGHRSLRSRKSSHRRRWAATTRVRALVWK
jgi:hypothetical protein